MRILVFGAAGKTLVNQDEVLCVLGGHSFRNTPVLRSTNSTTPLSYPNSQSFIELDTGCC